MTVRDIIDAIESGDSVAVQQSFESEISSRIADRLDVMKTGVAQNMFRSEAAAEVAAEPAVDVINVPEGE